jgi:hypothetical protein
MAEEVGHGPDIHAYMVELGCREVTEVVETHVGCPCAAWEGLRDLVALAGLRVVAEGDLQRSQNTHVTSRQSGRGASSSSCFTSWVRLAWAASSSGADATRWHSTSSGISVTV